MEYQLVFAIAAGLIAGLIDSIAGGGGLITVPSLALLMGPGVHAIATNKIAATMSSAVALFVYSRHGHVSVRNNWSFAVLVGIGALFGSQVAHFLPTSLFKWMLVVVAPIILFLLWKKELWIQVEMKVRGGADATAFDDRRLLLMFAFGFAAGFYDGIAGPGGGTFMFLVLFLVARLPLRTALGTAKIANLTSAFVSLSSYSAQGLVSWQQGAPMAIGISIGAYFGSTYVSRHTTQSATKLVRWALAIVATLLILRLLTIS